MNLDKFVRVVLLILLSYLVLKIGSVFADTTYFSSYTLKKTKLGPKNKIVTIESITDNGDQTATLEIRACGTKLEFTAKTVDFDTPGFQNYVMEQVDNVCK